MIFVYSLGKYLYFRGLLLLIVAAIGESFVSYVYFGGVNWPNPLPLLLYMSLVLLGHDRYRKMVATALIISSAISFSALLGILLAPSTRNGGLLFYSFYLADGIVQGYVGWRIVLHGFVRFYLLGLRMDDKMRQSETSDTVREELDALRNALPNSTEHK